MKYFNVDELQKLYIPSENSHKGQNGRLMVIGGSKLFHAASLWSLTIASKIVDMVFYASVSENNEMVQSAKEEFRNGIVVPRSKIGDYIEEADCILIGPGLPRPEGQEVGDDNTKKLTEDLLKKYPHKQWVIDGGSLQTITPNILPSFRVMPILTPHKGEFEKLFKNSLPSKKNKARTNQVTSPEFVQSIARKYSAIILLKGPSDIICSPDEFLEITGGNAGMTKGGTGDVLAGLVAALACKNDPFLAAKVGSYINKKAAESLFKKVGYYFNASDLIEEIPHVMQQFL